MERDQNKPQWTKLTRAQKRQRRKREAHALVNEQSCKVIYGRRNQILRQMGFPKYKDYLASDLWKSIRQRVLDRDNRKCHVCRGPAWQVHHKNYHEETLRGTCLDALVTICPTCHTQAEFDTEGTKNAPKFANQAMIQRRKKLTAMFVAQTATRRRQQFEPERKKFCTLSQSIRRKQPAESVSSGTPSLEVTRHDAPATVAEHPQAGQPAESRGG